MRRYYIKTYGCQMNVADSEKLARVLASAGYHEAKAAAEAELILVNTCVVRQNAEDRASGYVSSLKGLKNKKPRLIIGLCGCLVTEPGRDVKKQFPHVDIFLPPNSPEKLGQYLKSLPYTPSPSGRGGRDLCADGGEGLTRYISIMHGCDNFCSYCVVPFVRGREYSRPVEEILAEIRESVDQNIREILLLGQNVNSYKYGLAKLLYGIEGLKGLYDPKGLNGHKSLNRIRFMTSHPRDMSDDIIQAVAELPHVCEYFHLPVQHGDDQMLKAMNRGYDSAYYLQLVDKIRAKIPGAAITSDVIVGYPGETNEQFQRTLYIIEQAGFDACNTAAYSVRPGTAAAKLVDDLPDEVKQQRLQQVMQVVETVARKQNDKLVGSVQEILVDQPGSGRTRTNKIVKFTSPSNDLLGQLVKVKIAEAMSWVLKGKVLVV